MLFADNTASAHSIVIEALEMSRIGEVLASGEENSAVSVHRIATVVWKE